MIPKFVEGSTDRCIRVARSRFGDPRPAVIFTGAYRTTERLTPPSSGPIFANSLGRHLRMDNVRMRSILPALNRCVFGGLPQGKKHAKQGYKYERNAALPIWRGWHAARRGLGSNLYRLGVPDKVIQAILRHSNVNVTLAYDVKSVSSDVQAATAKFEEGLAVRNVRDTAGTPKADPGATSGFVN